MWLLLEADKDRKGKIMGREWLVETVVQLEPRKIF